MPTFKIGPIKVKNLKHKYFFKNLQIENKENTLNYSIFHTTVISDLSSSLGKEQKESNGAHLLSRACWFFAFSFTAVKFPPKFAIWGPF